MDGSSFTFAVDAEIRFGSGVRRDVGNAAARFGRRAALVTGRTWLADSPHLSELNDHLDRSGVEVVTRSIAKGEPDADDVERAAAQMRSAGIDVVIAIGGGSALDLAKASAIVATGKDLRALLGGAGVERSGGVPVVALPTTAGSGAEASRGAIVLDRRSGKKRGIRGAGVAPRVALVDPELVASCPAVVTARAGFDAVAHAVETTVSRAASPVTRALARDALSLLLWSVPRSVKDGGDMEARAAASYAALLMGINLANSTTCLPHRMQYPLGALTGTEHAVGVAALTRPWLERALQFAPERLAELAPAVGHGGEDTTSAARSVARAVVSLLEELGLDVRLRDLGVQDSDLAQLAAAVEGAVENDPGPTDTDALRRLYQASL